MSDCLTVQVHPLTRSFSRGGRSGAESPAPTNTANSVNRDNSSSSNSAEEPTSPQAVLQRDLRVGEQRVCAPRGLLPLTAMMRASIMLSHLLAAQHLGR